jgi:hypothetical protein
MRRHFAAEVDTKTSEYLNECASIRGISMGALVRRLLETIANDRMVLSILDDDNSPKRRKNERAARKKPQCDLRKGYPL